MPRPKREMQDGRLLCPSCSTWLHYSKFSPSHKTRHGTVARFHPMCRDCEQSERDDKKLEDRATVKITASAASHAAKWHVTRDQLLYDLGWLEYLHDWVEACLEGRAKCVSCRHPFIGPDDVQIDIRDPVRHPADTARMDVRNVGPLCRSCNIRKKGKPYSQWLEEEDAARRSVAARYGAQSAVVVAAEVINPSQETLFDLLGDP